LQAAAVEQGEAAQAARTNGEAKGEDRKTGFVLIVFPFTQAENAKAGQPGNPCT
jgi:hypothetical protein